MSEMEILKKLNSAADMLVEKAINDEHDKVHYLHIKNIADELRKCEEVKRIGRRWMPVKSLEVEISPFSLNVQNQDYKKKITAVYSYADELVKKLNDTSEFLKFKFSGHAFIGRFVRNNGNCIISVSWRY